MALRSEVIIGIETVAGFLGVSRNTVYGYLRMGMPGVRINGLWHFHAANVDGWFRAVTAKRMPQAVISENGEDHAASAVQKS
jgi:hypothetical protein